MSVRRVIKCGRCSRRYRGHGDWNVTAKRGVLLGFLCPSCQTPEENAEALINEGTLDYFTGTDGLIRSHPKVTS